MCEHSSSQNILWPTDKLCIRRRAMCAFTESVGDAVLILTGGLNPIHRAHVTAMEIARARCEEAGYRVVAGYLSPSHDTYVGPKMRNTGARCFSATDRVALVKSAVASSPWLDVAAWEGLFYYYVPSYVIQRDPFNPTFYRLGASF